MDYTVYEVFPDGKKFFRFESDHHIDCEVYVRNHWYDHKYSTLIIEESEDLKRIKELCEYKMYTEEKRMQKIKRIGNIIMFVGAFATVVWIWYEAIRQLLEII